MKEIWQNSLIVMVSMIIFSTMLYFFTPYLRLEQAQYAKGSILKEEKIKLDNKHTLHQENVDNFIYFKEHYPDKNTLNAATLYVVEGNINTQDWQKIKRVNQNIENQLIVFPLNQWLEPHYDDVKQTIVDLLKVEGIEKLTICSESTTYSWLIKALVHDMREQHPELVITSEDDHSPSYPDHLWYYSNFSYLFYWSVKLP